MAKPVTAETQRPQAVIEIAGWLFFTALLFACPGLCFLASGFAGFTDPSSIVGGTLIVLGAMLIGIPALGFYRLQKWSYPIVRILVSTFWGINIAFLLGLHKKIKYPEVRRAFGLDPDSEQKNR